MEEALQDGIIDVDEAQAVAALQDKMNSITSKWKQAEAQAQLDWINQEYGKLSGKDLTSESFGAVVEALAGQRDTAAQETQALATEFYSYLNAAESSGRITATQNEYYKNSHYQGVNYRGFDEYQSEHKSGLYLRRRLGLAGDCLVRFCYRYAHGERACRGGETYRYRGGYRFAAFRVVFAFVDGRVRILVGCENDFGFVCVCGVYGF